LPTEKEPLVASYQYRGKFADLDDVCADRDLDLTFEIIRILPYITFVLTFSNNKI
jgi:hypothetical protein